MSRFTKIFVRKAWIACLLFLLVVTGGLYFLRRENYFLNKNVRLVCMRIFEYQELSFHRRLRYRIEFLQDRYRIYVLIPLPEETWKEVKEIRYEDGVETNLPGFAFEIQKGRIVSYQRREDWSSIRRPVVLGFFASKNPQKQSGILFHRDGTWRGLKR
jgi:hypothetical protein